MLAGSFDPSHSTYIVPWWEWFIDVLGMPLLIRIFYIECCKVLYWETHWLEATAVRFRPSELQFVSGLGVWLVRGFLPQTCYRIPLGLVALLLPVWLGAAAPRYGTVYLTVAAVFCLTGYCVSSPLLRGWRGAGWSVRYLVSGVMFAIPVVAAFLLGPHWPRDQANVDILVGWLAAKSPWPYVMFLGVLLGTIHLMEATASLAYVLRHPEKMGCV